MKPKKLFSKLKNKVFVSGAARGHVPWLTLTTCHVRDVTHVKFNFIFISCPLSRFFTLFLAPPTNYAIDLIISSGDMKDKSGQKGGKFIWFFIISLMVDIIPPPAMGHSLSAMHSIKVQGHKAPAPTQCHRFKYDPNSDPGRGSPREGLEPFPCFNWALVPWCHTHAPSAPHKQYKWWHWRRSLRTRTYFYEERVWSPWSGLRRGEYFTMKWNDYE